MPSGSTSPKLTLAGHRPSAPEVANSGAPAKTCAELQFAIPHGRDFRPGRPEIPHGRCEADYYELSAMSFTANFSTIGIVGKVPYALRRERLLLHPCGGLSGRYKNTVHDGSIVACDIPRRTGVAHVDVRSVLLLRKMCVCRTHVTNEGSVRNAS